MAKMNSKFKYMYDAAPSVALAPNDGVAVTADTNFTPVALDQLDGYWNTQGELADQTFAVAINVTELELGDDEEYALSLQFGDAVGFGGDTVTTHTLAVTATGQYALLVDIDTVVAMLADPTHMRLALDVTASTGSPSIKLTAWIAGRIIV